MRRKIPPNPRPSFQGKPGGLSRCTVQQAQAPLSVTRNLQHSRGVRGTEEGGRRPRNSPPARPALGEMCARTIAVAIGASVRRRVHRNGAERRREHVPHSTASDGGRPRICPGRLCDIRRATSPSWHKKSRSKMRRSHTGTPNKRSKNTILDYFHSQKS